MATKRIDTLHPLTKVVLRFGPRDMQEAVFVGMNGEGDDRKAVFMSVNREGYPFEWEAHRANNRWCYGSNGGALAVEEVLA